MDDEGLPPVLRAPALEAALAAEGYATTPFLDDATVAHLLAQYERLVPAADRGLVTDYMSWDRSVMRDVAELLEPVWACHLPRLFVDPRPVMTTFVVKHPGEDSVMYLHTDRAWVDERRHRAVTIWIPLVDVGPDLPNGGIQVVPRTHLIGSGWGGTNTADLFRPFETTLRDRLVTPALRAGDAAIYDARTLHSSAANRTGRRRVAVACAVIPADADLIHIRATGPRRRVAWAVDEDFYLDLHPRDLEALPPDAFPVVHEFDVPLQLDARRLAAVMGVPHVDVDLPALPADDDDGRPRRPFEHEQRSAAPLPRDLVVHLDEVEGRVDAVAGLAVEPRTAEGVTVLELPRRLPRWMLEQVELVRALPARGLLVRDRLLLVLAPGARVSIGGTTGRHQRVELTVIDGPGVGAGVADERSVAAFDPGRTIVVGSDGPAVVWNDGPGQLVAVLDRRFRRAPALVA